MGRGESDAAKPAVAVGAGPCEEPPRAAGEVGGVVVGVDRTATAGVRSGLTSQGEKSTR